MFRISLKYFKWIGEKSGHLVTFEFCNHHSGCCVDARVGNWKERLCGSKQNKKTSFAKVQARGSGSMNWVLVEMGKPEQMEGS